MSGSLERSPADIIRHLLIDLGLGVLHSDDTAAAWPIFVGREPNVPDSCITIYDTAGSLQGRMMTNGQTVEFYGVQIRVRDPDHQDGWVKANALLVALDETITNNMVTIDDLTGTGTSTYQVHATTRTTGVFL